MVLNTILLTQARTGSTRLPGKVLMKVNNKSLLEIHLERIAKSKMVDRIIVATTTNEQDDLLFKNVVEWGYEIYRGSENDVLDRFYQAIKDIIPNWVVRVTSDCPLIDPVLIDEVINFSINNDLDYCSNTFIEAYPDGQDVEVFKFTALEMAWKNAKLLSEREHVTPYIRNKSNLRGGLLFSAINYPCENDYSKIRMTVDEIEDFYLIEILINKLGINKTWIEYTNFIIANKLNLINGEIVRNDGYLKSLKKV
jgi:spore coat polysaccharide biosynthesis protein SpsF